MSAYSREMPSRAIMRSQRSASGRQDAEDGGAERVGPALEDPHGVNGGEGAARHCEIAQQAVYLAVRRTCALSR